MRWLAVLIPALVACGLWLNAASSVAAASPVCDDLVIQAPDRRPPGPFISKLQFKFVGKSPKNRVGKTYVAVETGRGGLQIGTKGTAYAYRFTGCNGPNKGTCTAEPNQCVQYWSLGQIVRGRSGRNECLTTTKSALTWSKCLGETTKTQLFYMVQNVQYPPNWGDVVSYGNIIVALAPGYTFDIVDKHGSLGVVQTKDTKYAASSVATISR